MTSITDKCCSSGRRIRASKLNKSVFRIPLNYTLIASSSCHYNCHQWIQCCVFTPDVKFCRKRMPLNEAGGNYVSISRQNHAKSTDFRALFFTVLEPVRIIRFGRQPVCPNIKSRSPCDADRYPLCPRCVFTVVEGIPSILQ